MGEWKKGQMGRSYLVGQLPGVQNTQTYNLNLTNSILLSFKHSLLSTMHKATQCTKKYLNDQNSDVINIIFYGGKSQYT